MDPTDHELLEAWANGDRGAGDELIKRHFGRVYRFFASKVPTAAEDLTQRTLLGCTESRAKIDPQRNFAAYLFGIARRVLNDHLRRLHRRPMPAELSQCAVEELTGKTIHGALAKGQEAQLILASLRQLPLDYQISLELHYWEAMGVDAIAEATGVAPGTVKSRLSRGRTMLAEKIRKKALRAEIGEATIRDLAGWSRSLGELLHAPPS